MIIAPLLTTSTCATPIHLVPSMLPPPPPISSPCQTLITYCTKIIEREIHMRRNTRYAHHFIIVKGCTPLWEGLSVRICDNFRERMQISRYKICYQILSKSSQTHIHLR